MLRPYDLLENVLLDIEQDIRKGINANTIADKYSLSERHLRKLFKFAFNQTMADYIRSRKLTASLDDLLKTDDSVLRIAFCYNFAYEQSYIRAFKEEFGITPGDFRKSGEIVKIKPPLYLFDENKMNGGLFFGPEFVMVPQFHIVGKSNRIPFNAPVATAPKLGMEFWENERKLISDVINPDTFFGLYALNKEEMFFEYTTSVQVKKHRNIPQGCIAYTFKTSLCACFRYIGGHNFYDMNEKKWKQYPNHC